MKLYLMSVSCWLLSRFPPQPWGKRHYVTLKHLLTSRYCRLCENLAIPDVSVPALPDLLATHPTAGRSNQRRWPRHNPSFWNSSPCRRVPSASLCYRALTDQILRHVPTSHQSTKLRNENSRNWYRRYFTHYLSAAVQSVFGPWPLLQFCNPIY
jgi:hypothetical protein